MDSSRFDAIARHVAGLPQSRRAALRLLAGSLTGAVLGGVGLRATPAAACTCQSPLDCCTGPAKCQDGICTTGDPYCTILKTDNRNCGQCGNVCPSGITCQSGVCTCPSGLPYCNGQCVDLQNDKANCGQCGKSCTGGKTCQSGQCKCPSGLTDCGGLCVDLQTNTNHCGSCGRYCGRCGRYAPRNKCVAGVCDQCTDGSYDVRKKKRRKSRKA